MPKLTMKITMIIPDSGRPTAHQEQVLNDAIHLFVAYMLRRGVKAKGNWEGPTPLARLPLPRLPENTK